MKKKSIKFHQTFNTNLWKQEENENLQNLGEKIISSLKFCTWSHWDLNMQ